MKQEMTTEELHNLLKERDMKQKELGEILNLEQPKISAIMNGKRKISDPEQKLLRLYFYGEMPFDLLAPQDGYGSELKFNEQEWRIIEVMSQRAGFSKPQDWIISQIRSHLAFMEEQSKSQQGSFKSETTIHPFKKGRRAIDLGNDEEKIIKLAELEYVGSVAAGEPIEAVLIDETVKAPAMYADGHHYVAEVNGESMQPTLLDGERIIFETKDKFSPANGKICVIADSHGNSIKRYDRKKNAYVSDNPDYPDFTPVGDVKLIGYFVAKLEE